MKRSLPAGICAFLLLPIATPALAQSPPQLVSLVTAPPDRRTGQDFAHAMLMSTKFAIVTSQLALDRSRDPAIRALAADTIAFDSKLDKDMKKSADRTFVNRRITPPPVFDPIYMKMYRPLEISSGAAFDNLYMSRQLWVHQELLATMEGYAGHGKVPQLQDFARKTVPVVRDRLAMLRSTGAIAAINGPDAHR